MLPAGYRGERVALIVSTDSPTSKRLPISASLSCGLPGRQHGSAGLPTRSWSARDACLAASDLADAHPDASAQEKKEYIEKAKALPLS